jgi:O-antigen/teichoic acid export membrane protein
VLFGGLVVVTVGWWRGGLQMAVAMLACSHVAAAVFLTACLQWRAPCLGLRLHSGVVRDWLAEAVPLGLGDVIRRLTWQLDTIVLRLLQPPAVVGVYSIAYRPLGPLNWLPRAILRAVFPTFARLAETDRAGLERAFAASIRLLWVTSLPIAVAIFVTAEPVIVILAGEEYLDAQGPMRVLIWVTSLSYLSLQFRFLFTALGRPRVYTVLVGLVLAVEAGLEFALIPWWGYYGACAGTLLGELLFTAIGLVACRWLGVGGIEWRALGAAAVAGALMGAALWPVRGVSLPLLILAVGLATAGYFLLCFALGALRWEELRRLSAQDRPVP